MKNEILALLICILPSALSAEIVFSSQVKNAKSDLVSVEKPLDGRYFPQIPERVSLDKNGRFEIKMPNNQAGFLILRIKGHKIRVFLQAGDKKDGLAADADDLPSSIRYSGPHAFQNQFLNSLPRIDLPFDKRLSEVENSFFKPDASPKDTYLEVLDYRESEKKLLKKSSRKDFSQKFKEALEYDIQMYYTSVFGSVVYRQWAANPSGFDKAWGVLAKNEHAGLP